METKERLILHYYEQRVALLGEVLEPVGKHHLGARAMDVKLVLKPLEALSREDAAELLSRVHKQKIAYEHVYDIIIGGKGWVTILAKNGARNFDRLLNVDSLEQREADFLRSKSYAVPFGFLSVSDQQEKGWIELVKL